MGFVVLEKIPEQSGQIHRRETAELSTTNQK
jgi:hypothetical protein